MRGTTLSRALGGSDDKSGRILISLCAPQSYSQSRKIKFQNCSDVQNTEKTWTSVRPGAQTNALRLLPGANAIWH